MSLPLTDTQLYSSLIAGLALAGVDSFSTVEDNHHWALGRAASAFFLSEMDHQNLMPIPSPFTGRYAELDNVLLRSWRMGFVELDGRFFTSVRLSASPERWMGLYERRCPELYRPNMAHFALLYATELSRA